ncbi:MAG TPA: hypothetical protein VGO18_17815, partial [Steroidobacteraceae bacterium]|nr:hypothetical protein [Steroidobacteraceae bacterium]
MLREQQPFEIDRSARYAIQIEGLAINGGSRTLVTVRGEGVSADQKVVDTVRVERTQERFRSSSVAGRVICSVTASL